MGQGNRVVVPLGEIADDRRGVLRAVPPLHSRPPHRRIQGVAEHQEDRDAAHPGVVNVHRGVLKAHGAVGHHQHRLPFDVGVAVRDADRRLLVTARQQLRRFVAAVVDERLVQRPEARSGVGGDVLEAQRLEYIHHEIGSRAIRRHHLHMARRDRPRAVPAPAWEPEEPPLAVPRSRLSPWPACRYRRLRRPSEIHDDPPGLCLSRNLPWASNPPLSVLWLGKPVSRVLGCQQQRLRVSKALQQEHLHHAEAFLFLPKSVPQKSNCTLNLMNRAARIALGCCHAGPNVLFCASTAFEFKML